MERSANDERSYVLRHIRDVIAARRRPLPGASTETRGLFTHVLPQAVLDRPREGLRPDIVAETRDGLRAAPAPADAPPPSKRRAVIWT